VTITASFTDVGTKDTHTCTIAWDDGSANTVVTAVETNGSGTCTSSHTYTTAGVYSPTVTVTDDDGGVSAAMTWKYVVVYDTSAGFVTGGGWINSPAGAYAANLTLAGKANFGFVSKYKAGQSIPTGETEFRL
jgi:PKD repeat protein